MDMWKKSPCITRQLDEPWSLVRENMGKEARISGGRYWAFNTPSRFREQDLQSLLLQLVRAKMCTCSFSPYQFRPKELP